MKASRFLITTFITLLLASCVPVTPAPQTAQAMGTNTVTYRTEDIKRVNMSHADLQYLPLFASREEDQALISTVAQALTKLIGKAKPYTNTMDAEQHFFATDFTITFNDDTSLSLTFASQDTVVIQDGEQEYYAQNADVVKELNKLLKMPEQTRISTLQPRIGETIRLTGSDAHSEQGPIQLYVIPDGILSGYTSVKGESFPSKRALRIYVGTISQARYDVSFPLPAYGEAVDGSLQPITPGKWELTYVTNGLTSSRQIEIQAPLKPLLSINGVPVTDPAIQPVLRDGRMLLPLRSLASALGWHVSYLGHSKQVSISTSSNGSAAMTAPQQKKVSLWIDGEPLFTPEAEPIVLNGVTYLPLRAIADAFHFDITWSKEIGSVHLQYQPSLLPLDGYAKDSTEYAIAAIVNEYAVALNKRDGQKLKTLFKQKDYFFPAFEDIGYRQITAVRDIRFQSRYEGKAYVAYVTFNYLFNRNGDNSSSPGIALILENNKWLIADID
ncbi:hypothetical protein BVG16_12100 [Paenibacillus selenitireducens]|uniref:Copper amine oxidase-like N-terminal domain-containing protein n=1 Tax=Paenibacillus selenitireducens TaxID=1324314 RepID=A0A1T2XFG9_9BACL|nr:stalk domain-containing protein [Paenibacillus selenitireducens]OPA78600.1 hypothetical protein BVG16_12100 [Paenibacillus selenitireducens]